MSDYAYLEQNRDARGRFGAAPAGESDVQLGGDTAADRLAGRIVSERDWSAAVVRSDPGTGTATISPAGSSDEYRIHGSVEGGRAMYRASLEFDDEDPETGERVRDRQDITPATSELAVTLDLVESHARSAGHRLR